MFFLLSNYFSYAPFFTKVYRFFGVSRTEA